MCITTIVLWCASRWIGASSSGAGGVSLLHSASPLLRTMQRLQVEECSQAGTALDAAASGASAPAASSSSGGPGGPGDLCAAQLAPGAQELRTLQTRLGSQPEAAALRVDAGGRHCRQLRVFLRISPVSASWSGAGRILRWRKEQVVLASLQGLRKALPPLAAVGVARINVTVLFDGLSAHLELLKAWRELVAEALLGSNGEAQSMPLGSLLSLRFLYIPIGTYSGNRGTNLVQFGLARSDPCFRQPTADGGDAAGLNLRVGALEAAVAAEAALPVVASRSGDGLWETVGSLGGASPAQCGADDGGDTLFYFVEDDYIHLPTALAELAQTLLNPWLDGSAPPDFVTLMDPPERLTRGRDEADYGGATLFGGALRVWRTVQSSTMTFAGTCHGVRAILPLMEKEAPYDHGIWLELRRRGFSLVGPMPALALHAVAAPELSWYSPAALGWCGIVWCMREEFRRAIGASDAGLMLRTNASN